MQSRARISALFLIALVLLGGPRVGSAEITDFGQLFSQLDANGDGRLAVGEVEPEHALLFTRLLQAADDNGDGQLSADEFEHGLQPQRPARPLADKKPHQFPGANALLLFVAQMDTNGDRRIVAAEVPEPLQDFFHRAEQRLGGEPDGQINRRELIQAAPKLSQLALRYAEQQDIDVDLELALLPEEQWTLLQQLDGPNRPGAMLADPQQAEEIFARLDVDGNGQITVEEVPEPFADRFENLLQQADQNGDSQLSRQELLTVWRRMAARKKDRLLPAEVEKRIKQILNRLDRNGDKLLGREETPQRMANHFDRLDADGNGMLDRQELTRAVELLRGMRKPEVKRPGKRRKSPKKRSFRPVPAE